MSERNTWGNVSPDMIAALANIGVDVSQDGWAKLGECEMTGPLEDTHGPIANENWQTRALKAEAALQEARMQSLAHLGQAQEAYEAQLKAEAELEEYKMVARTVDDQWCAAEDEIEAIKAKLAKAVEVAEKAISWLRLYGADVHKEAATLAEIGGDDG